MGTQPLAQDTVLPPALDSMPYYGPNLHDCTDYTGMLEGLEYLFRVEDSGSRVRLTQAGLLADAWKGRPRYPISLEKAKSDYVQEHVRNFKHGVGSPWISFTPLWTYAIAEAIKRMKLYKSEVRIILVDVRTLLHLRHDSGRPFYAVDLIKRLPGYERDSWESKWANTPQEVLVYHEVPIACIISTIFCTETFLSVLPPMFFPQLNSPRVLDSLPSAFTHWRWFLDQRREYLKRLQYDTKSGFRAFEHGRSACSLACTLLSSAWKVEANNSLEEASSVLQKVRRWRKSQRTESASDSSNPILVLARALDGIKLDDMDGSRSSKHEYMDSRDELTEKPEPPSCSNLYAVVDCTLLLSWQIASWGINWTHDNEDRARKRVEEGIKSFYRNYEDGVVTRVETIKDEIIDLLKVAMGTPHEPSQLPAPEQLSSVCSPQRGYGYIRRRCEKWPDVSDSDSEDEPARVSLCGLIRHQYPKWPEFSDSSSSEDEIDT